MSKTDVLEVFKKRCRHPYRARASHVINRLFSDFVPFENPSGSLISGRGRFMDKTFYVIGQQKPTPDDLKSSEDLKRLNFGMLTADDHSHILSILEKAGNSDPKETMVFTIVDTYGADISMYSAQRFQAFFIAHIIREFLTIPVRTISLILGEGGSGGAVAIQYADVRGMMDDALYATAPPEGTASILFRDPTRIRDALTILRPTAKELKALNIVDRIVPSPDSVTDTTGMVESIGHFLIKASKDLFRSKIEKLIKKREIRAKQFGLSKVSGSFFDFKRYIEQPIKKAFRKPPPDIQIVNYASITEVNEDYGRFKNFGRETELIRCGEGKGGEDRLKGCGELVALKDLIDNFNVCPECGYTYPLGATGWIDCLADTGTFHELYRNLTVEDILESEAITDYYREFLAKQEGKSDFKESLVAGAARVNHFRVTMAIGTFTYCGGSMGVVFGEKFRRAVDYAIQENLPFISLCCSGGARLYEGTPALMQMVKTVESVNRLKRHGLPYISILADPATGGAIASYAALGDVTIAEPGALVTFAGPRVMKARGFDVDEKFIRADYLTEISRKIYSMLDYYHDIRGIQELVPRKDMKLALSRYLELYFRTSPRQRKKGRSV